MTESDKGNAALFLAFYASTAATIAITALRKDGLVDDPVFAQLLENLEICRDLIGDDPRLSDHLALLENMLADGRF